MYYPGIAATMLMVSVRIHGININEWHMAGTNMLYAAAIFYPVKTGYFKISITTKRAGNAIIPRLAIVEKFAMPAILYNLFHAPLLQNF